MIRGFSKIIVLMIVGIMAMFAFGCSGQSSTSSTSDTSGKNGTTAATPADLTGEWKQVNNKSEDAWQAAVIEGETITIHWVSDNGDTKSLYWAGTFVVPTTADEPYSWDSKNDRSQTDMAMLASGDDTKTITYEKGQLSYSASALGTTTTVRLEKQD